MATDPILILRARSSGDAAYDDRPRWRPLRDGARWSATLTCGLCGRPATLVDHEIADDGTVSPSVECPHDGCRWHVFVKLNGWAAS